MYKKGIMYMLFSKIDLLKVYKLKNTKIRLGKENDGGYVILDGFSYDILIGCGISADISFETQFINKYDVDCYAFDGTVEDLPQPNTRIKFIKKNISKRNSLTETNLRELISKYNNIFLKMDIEGSEYSWINTLKDDDLNRIKQIAIEFHWPFGFFGARWRSIRKLTNTHYLCHIHANNGPGVRKVGKHLIPNVFECTFIRKKDINYIPVLNDEKFPTKLDMKCVAGMDDIILDGFPYVNRK